MRPIDIERDPRPTHRSATRRRSVSFTSKGRPTPSAGTSTSYYYQNTPSYIPPPPPPPPPPLANPTRSESRWNKIPGAFPEDRTNSITYAPLPPFLPPSPPVPAPVRRKSFGFGDYIPNPLTWASGVFSRKDAAATTYYPPPATTATTAKLMALAEAENKSKMNYERTMRMYAEQSHQETIKQQLLELELKKTQEELKLKEEAARQRLYKVCHIAEQPEQGAMVPYTSSVPPSVAFPVYHAHDYHHSDPHCTHHHYVWNHSGLSEEEIAVRRYRRDHHHCSRCGRRGHYSKECRAPSRAPSRAHSRSSSPAPSILRSRRRSVTPSRLIPGPSEVRGYLAPGGSSPSSPVAYSTDDEEWALVAPGGSEGSLFFGEPTTVDEDGYPVAKFEEEDYLEIDRLRRGDNGVLVYYDEGAAPGKAWPRNSVRHVVGV